MIVNSLLSTVLHCSLLHGRLASLSYSLRAHSMIFLKIKLLLLSLISDVIFMWTLISTGARNTRPATNFNSIISNQRAFLAFHLFYRYQSYTTVATTAIFAHLRGNATLIICRNCCSAHHIQSGIQMYWLLWHWLDIPGVTSYPGIICIIFLHNIIIIELMSY